MFNKKLKLYEKPEIYEKGTTSIWTDPYISKQLLQAHLNPAFDGASRRPEFIDSSVQWLAEVFPVDQFPKVIDFGCGPGLYTERLAKRGYVVTGLDFSKESIGYAEASAQNQKLPIHYIQADYLEWKSEEAFDLALLIYCDYGALNPLERRKLLQTINQSLRTGGRFILDNFTRYHMEEPTGQVWDYVGAADFWTEEEHLLLSRTENYEEHTSLSQTIVIKAGNEEVFNIWKYHSTQETLSEELEAAGFRVQGIYQDLTGEKYHSTSQTIAIIGEKLSASEAADRDKQV